MRDEKSARQRVWVFAGVCSLVVLGEVVAIQLGAMPILPWTPLIFVALLIGGTVYIQRTTKSTAPSARFTRGKFLKKFWFLFCGRPGCGERLYINGWQFRLKSAFLHS